MITSTVSVNELFSYIDGIVGNKTNKSETESETRVEEGFREVKFGGIVNGVNLEAFEYLREDLNNVVRIGLLKNIKLKGENQDVSFWTSLMHCCGLIAPTDTTREQNDKVRSFLLKTQEDYNREKLFTTHNLKRYKWRRRDILDHLQGFQTTEALKILVSNYLCINILVLDSATGDITAYYSTEANGHTLKFNVHNTNVIILYHNNCYEPIVHSDRKSTLWTSKSEIIKHLLNDYVNRIVSFESKNGFNDFAFSFTNDEDLTRYLSKVKEQVKEQAKEQFEDDSKDKSEESTGIVNYGKTVETNRENQFEECDDADSVEDVVIDEDVVINEDVVVNDEEDVSKKRSGDDDNCDKYYSNNEELVDISQQNQDFNLKSSLLVLQSLATKRGISLVEGKYKNGIHKLKTKKQLIADLL